MRDTVEWDAERSTAIVRSPHDLLDEIVDAADYSVIGPHDSRVHEIATTTFPFNTICHVERDFGDGRWRGCSGVLVGKRTLLTAGHCLYSHLLRRAPARIRVIPGRRDRDTMPLGMYEVASAFVPTAYLSPARVASGTAREHDVGVAHLARSVHLVNRFMSARAYPTDALERVRREYLVTIAGYPGDRPVGTMWRHTERLTHIGPRRLSYTVDTCPGHSGSPIWYRRTPNDRIVIGVHTSGVVDEMGRAFGCSPGTVLAPAGLRNGGVRVSRSLVQTMRDIERTIGRIERLPNMVRVK